MTSPLHVFFAIFVAFLWGLNFVVAKVALVHFPPFFLLSFRLFAVALVLLPFVKKPHISWRRLWGISLSLGIVHFGFMYLALRIGIDASIGVIVDQIRVPIALILGVVFLKEKVGWRSIGGMIIAFLGMGTLYVSPNVSGNPIGFMLLIGSTIGWAVYSMQLRKIADKKHVFGFLAWLSLITAPQLGLISFFMEEGQLESVMTASLKEWLAFSYITFVIIIGAHGLWYYLLSHHPVSTVAPYSLLQPCFGVLAAIAFLGETLNMVIFFGLFLTISGVAIIVSKKPKQVEAGDEI
jgi:O-acetylserine/cysteine efflux transporter